VLICNLQGGGVEGLLKDSDKLFTHVHCTVHSVASESLSNAPNVSASQLLSFQLGKYAKKRRLQVYNIAHFIEETYQEENIIFEIRIKFFAF
jgi:hypothetical protein